MTWVNAFVVAAVLAATPAGAQSPPIRADNDLVARPPGYTYGERDGKPFWQQCDPDGYCFGRVGGKPFWFQQAPDADRERR